ncbi:MAG: glycosyl hydrolase, partial [Armatimonadota bacterium]
RRLMTFCGRIQPAVRFGTHVAQVAVLYPIRTAWAQYIPTSEVLSAESQPEPLASMDDTLLRIARELLRNQVDFDFVDSRSLQGAEMQSGTLSIANETYELLLIPPGTALSSTDIESINRFAESGGRILAFQPVSEFPLSDIAGKSLSGIQSACEAIGNLSARFDTVMVESLEDDWQALVRGLVTRDLVLVGDTKWVVVRQSRFADGDVFLVVNASDEPVSLEAHMEDFGSCELWNPTDGTVTSFSGKLFVEGYSARIIVQRRSFGHEHNK